MSAAPLPIVESIFRAYRLVGELIGHLPKTMAVPYALSLLLAMPIMMAPGSQSFEVLLGLLGLIPYTLFAVAWHRLVMLGPQVAAPPLMPVWKKRHWRFLSYSLLIVGLIALALVATVLVIAPFQDVPAVGVMVILLSPLFTYVMLRLSLVLPASALDEEYRLTHSWAHTRGQGLRLLVILFLTLLPMVIVMMFVGSLLSTMISPGEGSPGEGGQLSAGQFVLFHLVSAVLGYIVTALSITVISQAFRDLAGWYPGPQHQA